MSIKKFGMCEFGLTGKDQMDCIYCDRCRYQAKAAVKKEHLPRPHHAPAKAVSRYFVVGVLITAILISTVSVSRFSKVIGADIGKSAGTQSAGGEPRDVDLQRIRTMIEQNRLSGHEAEFYKKVEQR
jgi:hypothetical protein